MIWIFAILAIPVVAWGMWLIFCRSIAKMHGVDGLKATPPVAKAFPVTAWVGSLKHVGPWIAQVVGHTRPAIPRGEDPPSTR